MCDLGIRNVSFPLFRQTFQLPSSLLISCDWTKQRNGETFNISKRRTPESPSRSFIMLKQVARALSHEGVWGSGCIDPRFLDLDISWRSVVSITPTAERSPGTH
jgi:hypothetical protein